MSCLSVERLTINVPDTITEDQVLQMSNKSGEMYRLLQKTVRDWVSTEIGIPSEVTVEAV